MLTRTSDSAIKHYSRVQFIEPTQLGYVHVAAEVQPRLPFLPASRRKRGFLAHLKQLTRDLAQVETVQRVTVNAAVAVPPLERLPGARERASARKTPRGSSS